MPYINIKLAGSLNHAQKEEIAKGVTDLMQQVANKPPSIHMLFSMRLSLRTGRLVEVC